LRAVAFRSYHCLPSRPRVLRVEPSLEGHVLHGNAGNDPRREPDHLFGDGGEDSALVDEDDVLESIEATL